MGIILTIGLRDLKKTEAAIRKSEYAHIFATSRPHIYNMLRYMGVDKIDRAC